MKQKLKQMGLIFRNKLKLFSYKDEAGKLVLLKSVD
jgi:hypothetical protein